MSVLPAHEVALEIGGLGYLGWTEIAVERSINAMSGSFDLTLASKEKTGAQDWPIEDGAMCRVLLGSEVLVTGYVDAVSRSIRESDRVLRVRGRDKAADLIDCSALNAPGSWSGKSLETIAKALLAPFDIALKIEGDVGSSFTKFALQPGESVFAAVDRLAHYRGLVAWSSGDGMLRIGNPDTGARTGRIVEGINVMDADASRDMSERYSQYVIKGQASGSDTRSGKTVAQIKGEASDGGVSRYRPLLVIAGEQSDKTTLGKRAAWEASVRYGRARPVHVTVPGWLTDDGTVWAPGARAACKIPSCKIDDDMLVERVRTVRNSDDGTVTYLDLVPPEAWTQLAESEASS